jgi:Na+/H+ antiporter NhaD/arsenite permease-like protein
MITFKYLVLGLTYLGLGLGYFPGLRINQGAIAIVGSALAVTLGILNLNTAWEAIDLGTIVFLFGMMVVNSALGASGFFQLTLEFLTRLSTINCQLFNQPFETLQTWCEQNLPTCAN